MTRPTTAGVIAVLAECEFCAWRDERKGALGRAAIHHDRTGHVVRTETTTLVKYGDQGEALAAQGQTSIEGLGE